MSLVERSTTSEATVVSPFANAIPEILVKIFNYTICSPHNYYEIASYRNIVTQPPWPFLFVCKHWRRVVLSSPTLWSTVVLLTRSTQINPSDGANGLSLYHSRVLDIHFRRSGDVPLTLVLVLTLSRTELKSTWERLITSRHRWRDVLINFMILDHDTPMDSSKCILRLCDMPKLESLSAWFVYEEDVTESLLGIELGFCPNLRQIKLSWRRHS
ncbi:hypothetical protein SCHPADRAFT_90711 [Schizopora paradoxa]|uniref:Uncharacterized protein n=1 Tax=Schizopora paradoxa TaxID=27342 RepID=A0A0H2S4M0_9AGAM|nr:hypothetical protein SCHPADRAFT_90711 [Schizopora paradoxa]